MKKFKKILLVAVLSFALFTTKALAKDKVKVYIFEAGGCPYCEREIEYLKGLKSYDEKFEIVRKELYVDHIDWEEGKDYNLGVDVAKAFLAKGFDQASYQGTPFVVISNIYAAASYSESLEDVINEAYEAGDQDVVGCFENKKDNCEDKIKGTAKEKKENKKEDDGKNTITAIIVVGVIVVLGAVILLVGKKK